MSDDKSELDNILELLREYAEKRHPGRWRWASVLIDLKDGPTDVQSVLSAVPKEG